MEETMIRLTPQRRIHVSDRAAVLAAALLFIVSWMGFSEQTSTDANLNENQAMVAQTDNKPVDTANAKRKLSISLLLFGKG